MKEVKAYQCICGAVHKEKETHKKAVCPCCETQIRLEDFTDELSFKEFEISGLCEDCQNELFEEEKN